MTRHVPDGKAALSRRDFLVHGSIYGGGLWVALQLPRPRALAAAQESSKPEVLTLQEWKTIEAITTRIIPSDEEPGAREAHCVNFIDKALAHEDAGAHPLYQQAVVGIDAVSAKRFDAPFAELAPQQQDAVLESLESGAAAGWPEGEVTAPLFFETVRAHTIIGFLADPKYGGNRDYAGWRVTGYPGPAHHRGGYTPEQMLGQQKIRTVWGEDV